MLPCARHAGHAFLILSELLQATLPPPAPSLCNRPASMYVSLACADQSLVPGATACRPGRGCMLGKLTSSSLVASSEA